MTALDVDRRVRARRPTARPAVRAAGAALTHVAADGPAMGGRIAVHVAAPADRSVEAGRAARAALSRVRAWAARLTRFDDASDLSRLNAAPAAGKTATTPAALGTLHRVSVRPTLAAVLSWGDEAGRMTGGIVDVTLLDARLAAESGTGSAAHAALGTGESAVAGAWQPAPAGDGAGERAWQFARFEARHGAAAGDRGTDSRVNAPARDRHHVLLRAPGVRFDLDGVAKGWLADRALATLATFPGAIVDADGDLAIRVAPGDAWSIGIDDPRTPGTDLAVVRLAARDVPEVFGLATSGVSIHRWDGGPSPRDDATAAESLRHHLIDPRTRRPARTDLVQATVLAGSAREAEAFAKAAVILGTAAGLAFLEASGVAGAVLLTARGESIALPRTLRWLA